LNRRAILATLASSLLGPQSAFARPPAEVSRLGVFFAGYRESVMKEDGQDLLKALATVGYVEGRNVAVEWRFSETDFSRSAQMAAELVRSGVDVLTTAGTQQTKALQNATKTIPIITMVGEDPVVSGFARSLALPGGNITGISSQHPDTPAKRVELIRKIVPKLDRLALIGDVRYRGAREQLRPYELAAKAVGLSTEVRLVDRYRFEPVFSEMARSGAGAAFLQFADSGAAEASTTIAIRHRIATIYDERVYVDRGGLVSFEMYHEDPLQRIASMIDKVFRGMKPAEIPWELPNRSHLAINLATAKLLGLTVPPDLLLRADQIVE
jgi:putative ABC transport system substrate-binding protein